MLMLFTCVHNFMLCTCEIPECAGVQAHLIKLSINSQLIITCSIDMIVFFFCGFALYLEPFAVQNLGEFVIKGGS